MLRTDEMIILKWVSDGLEGCGAGWGLVAAVVNTVMNICDP